ncbi:MAG: fasciclin domain-containing protein, partial [Imperialibacter sp.]
MKTPLKFLAFGLITLAVASCSTPTNKTEEAGAVVDATPKGQASVVDDESAKNILQIAASSPDHTT